MSLYKIFCSSLMLGALIFGACEGFAVNLKTVMLDQNFPEGWEATKKNSRILGEFWEVTEFPKKSGKTSANHAPKRERQSFFDCIVLSPCISPAKLGDTLRSWIQNGRFAHYIVTEEKEFESTLLQWMDPDIYKGQMAGPDWDDRSLQVLVQTDENRKVTFLQIEKLRSLCKRPCINTDLKCLGDHKEAQRSEENGKITNIGAVREALGLRDLPRNSRR